MAKTNARRRRSPEQSAEGLLALNDVLQVRVDAPRSPLPSYATGDDRHPDSRRHKQMLESALAISKLTGEGISVKFDGLGINTHVDMRGYIMGALFKRGPIAKSIHRSLRTGLRNWPG